MIAIPESALRFGFENGLGGAHTSRTLMLSELQLLFAACSATATYQDYCAAILDENCLLKQTATTRRRSLWALRELYGLDRRLLVFRALRDLWEISVEAQPLLACLCAMARDPLLRSTSKVIVEAQPGAVVASDALSTAIAESFPGRLNANILDKVGRNAASSWTQSGHLIGRQTKLRTVAQSSPATVAYALLLGHLCDVRGNLLFETLWARLLDAPARLLHEQAFAASRLGWLEYRHAGDVTDVQFSYLLRAEERTGE